ncbi:MAG: hypothetical protein RR557_07545 [Bacilli bacterium]
MWIEELPNGKYKYVERYRDSYTDMLKKASVTYKSKSRQAKKDAEIELKKKINDIINNSMYTNNDITFGEVVDEWLERYKHQVKQHPLRNNPVNDYSKRSNTSKL